MPLHQATSILTQRGLSEWMELFPEGKLETDEQKALREENEKLRAKQYEMLAAWIAAC